MKKNLTYWIKNLNYLTVSKITVETELILKKDINLSMTLKCSSEGFLLLHISSAQEFVIAFRNSTLLASDGE